MKRILVFGFALVLVVTVGLVILKPLQATLAENLGLASSSPDAGTSENAAPTPSVQEPISPLPTATSEPPATPTPAPQPTAAPTPTPAVTPTPRPPVSYLENGTLVTIYGRGFGVAPILGRLGSSNDFDELATDMKQFAGLISAINDGKTVIPAVHLIYAMAIPCEPNDDCLLYLEGTHPDVVKRYIEPAAARGWQVILDTQLGRSDPVTQVKRMIDKGYLNYDNVHVALDPEFHSVPGHDTPGIPIGTVDATQINQVQQILDEHVRKVGLPHRKVLIVHQFGDANVDDGVPFMIQNKQSLKTYPNVDLVIDADGFGHPDSKATKYNRMTDNQVYPFVQWRGIKLFLPNPHEQTGHFDQPQMSFEMAFGVADTQGGFRIKVKPNVIVIA